MLEVCVDRVDHALLAIEAGADRIELNCALDHDGLTPSAVTCRWLKEHSRVPVVAMLRIHDRDFRYSAAEQTKMLDDCRDLLDADVDSIVYGSLTPSGEVNLEQLQEVLDACGMCPVVFHRAFDRIEDQPRALEQLAAAGVTRILTSGGAATAELGILQLKKLFEIAGGEIEILPASGIRSSNAIRILEETGCRQLHASFRSAGNGRLDLADLSRCAQQVRRYLEYQA